MPTFSNLTITDSSADQDKGAALILINRENERRAALEVPETPLPTSTNGEIVSSYIYCLENIVLPNAHERWKKEAAEKELKNQSLQERWAAASDAERAAALAELPTI